MLSDPLDTQVFASLKGLKGLVLAVSGGPDSLALMLLAAQWRAEGDAPPLHVATVDHGLRPDSASEAEKVAEWAQAHNLSHQILVWSGAKPARRLQERAREARYDLLFAHARSLGAEAVVTAHHADDQFETLLFRLLRGSGVAGLAAMAPLQIMPGGLLARPFLALPKQALVDFCRSRNQAFFEDPSNLNPAFARTRLRVLAGPLDEMGFSRVMATRLAARARKADEAVDWAARAIFFRLAVPPPNDHEIGPNFSQTFDLSRLDDAPQAGFERFLSLAISNVAQAGADEAVFATKTPLRLDRLERVAEKLRSAGAKGENFRSTLGGCLLMLDAKGRLTLRQEPARQRGSPGK